MGGEWAKRLDEAVGGELHPESIPPSGCDGSERLSDEKLRLGVRIGDEAPDEDAANCGDSFNYFNILFTSNIFKSQTINRKTLKKSAKEYFGCHKLAKSSVAMPTHQIVKQKFRKFRTKSMRSKGG